MQNKPGFCCAHLFYFPERPQSSAAFSPSSKWFISHLQLSQAVCNGTAFYYLGIVFGEATRVEANELRKSKEDIRNKLLNYILFHPPSYAKTPLKRSHCVDNE